VVDTRRVDGKVFQTVGPETAKQQNAFPDYSDAACREKLQTYNHGQDCGAKVGVPRSPGFPRRRSFPLRKTDSGNVIYFCILCTLDLVLCGFGRCTVLAALKFSLYTIVHLLLEEFKISIKSSFSVQSVCHTVSYGVGIGVWTWSRSRSPGLLGPGVRVGVQVFTAGVGVPQK